MPVVHTIDLDYLGRPRSIAAFLVIGPTGPVLIEAGPAVCLEALEAGLARHGVRIEDLAGVLLSHIHLDHAGAAGALAARGVPLWVHEFGAPHLVDPSRLIASATRIYGDTMNDVWGPITPAPADLVHAVRDGDVIEAGGLTFTAMETPGHARHHHAFVLETADGPIAFTGDAAATALPGTPFISLPCPPPEFDLDQWLATLDRLEAAGFARIHPTHFGTVDDVSTHLDRVRGALRDHVTRVEALADAGMDDAAVREEYGAWIRAEADRLGVPEDLRAFYVSASVTRMNVTGILRARARRAQPA